MNATGRLARWSLSLLEYDFDIVHRKGSSYLVPDALSRMYEVLPPEEIHIIKDPIPSWYTSRFLAVSDYPERFPTWKIVQDKLYRYQPNTLVSDFVDDLDGWKLVPNDVERQSVLTEAHDDPQSGHLGVQKTYIRSRYPRLIYQVDRVYTFARGYRQKDKSQLSVNLLSIAGEHPKSS